MLPLSAEKTAATKHMIAPMIKASLSVDMKGAEQAKFAVSLSVRSIYKLMMGKGGKKSQDA